MEEIWKDIEGYEGLYQVSNLGRVKTLRRTFLNGRTTQEKILKLQLDRYGYKIVELSKSGKSKKFKVHRLVAIAFIPNDNDYKEINHINEIKSDNRVTNLEWCTRWYNVHYGKNANGTNYGKRGRRKSNSYKALLQYTMDMELVNTWESLRQATETGLYTESGIRHSITGRQKHHKGYIWKYDM